jgi:hypothetical protein
VKAFPYAEFFEDNLIPPWDQCSPDVMIGNNDTDSIRSADVGDGESTRVALMVSVPASGKDLSFYWKVYSEANRDFFAFYIDGAEISRISGIVDWIKVTDSLAAGDHLLEWVYSKDGSISTDYDCGWIDDVVIE